MPLSVEDLERQQHFQRKVIEDSYSENGLRGGGISAPIGPPPSRQTDHRQSESGGIQDDPAVLATRIDTTGMQSPVTRRDEPVGTNQLHPQHRQAPLPRAAPRQSSQAPALDPTDHTTYQLP